MVPSAASSILRLAAAILVLAGSAGAPVAARAAELAEREAELIAQIQAILGDDGPHSARLLEPLTALNVLYREQNDGALAAVTIERARQVVRANHGLHTLDQMPLMSELMRIEEDRGNHAAAWGLEQDMLTLARRHPEDLRTVGVLRGAAERRMALLATYLGGARPAQLYLGCYYGGDCSSGSREGVVRAMLADAQRHYWDAAAVLLRNGQYASDELRELELEMLRGADFLRTTYGRDAPWSGMESYQRGRQSLRRLYAYGAVRNSPTVQQAAALVEMADWELLYSHHGVAVDSYELALAMLRRAGNAEAAIRDLFQPRLPTVLPAFQPNPLAPNETMRPTGHIDVAFKITKYGRGRAVEIVAATNAPREAEERLVSLVMNSRFRPQLARDTLDGAARVAVRYYLYDDGAAD